MTTVVNGHDAALWPVEAAPDAPAKRRAETTHRRARAGAHRAGDLVWARICWGATLAGMSGALLLLATVAYRSAG